MVFQRLVRPMQGWGVYRIPCSCLKYCISQTGHPFKTLLKEHIVDTNHNWVYKYTLVEQSRKSKNLTCFNQSNIIAFVPFYNSCIIWEALESRKTLITLIGRIIRGSVNPKSELFTMSSIHPCFPIFHLLLQCLFSLFFSHRLSFQNPPLFITVSKSFLYLLTIFLMPPSSFYYSTLTFYIIIFLKYFLPYFNFLLWLISYYACSLIKFPPLLIHPHLSYIWVQDPSFVSFKISNFMRNYTIHG